jgi:predicted alpha/beta hydrolase family esterase
VKRAAILHGTDGSPTELVWQTWLKDALEHAGYDVYFPQLPNCDEPNVATYDAFIQKSGWDFHDSILIGHSSGATTALHLLQQDWFPHVRSTILVGTFLNEDLVHNASWYTPGKFKNLFVDTFDVKKIRNKSGSFYFVHGDDDPYCDYQAAKDLCDDVGGTFIAMHGAGHIAKSAGITKLPLLLDKLKTDSVL